MKKIKPWLIFISIAAIFVCTAVPLTSWAYKATVFNDFTNITDGNVFYTIYWGADANKNFREEVPRGDYRRYNNAEWHAVGLCWDKIVVEQPADWKDADNKACPSSGRKETESLGKCSDVEVHITRSGCNVKITVK